METKDTKKLYAAFITFAVALLAAIPLRAFQAARLIESDTGFYSNASHITVPILYAVLIVAGVAVFGLLFFKTKLPMNMSENKNTALAVVSFIFAVTIIVDASVQVYNLFYITNSFSTLVSHYSLAGYFAKSGGFALVLEVVFGVLSALFFAVFGMYKLGLFGTLSRFKLLAVCPLIWVMSRIVFRFLKTIRILNVSDLLLELFMLVFAMLFFLAFARIVANIEPEGSVKRLYSYGLIAALLLLCVCLPRVMLYITGMSDKIVSEYPLNLCDLGMAAFIITFLFSVIKTNVKDNKDEEGSEEETANSDEEALAEDEEPQEISETSSDEAVQDNDEAEENEPSEEENGSQNNEEAVSAEIKAEE